MSKVSQIIYCSRKGDTFDETQLDDFLKQIRRKNKKNRVTGILLLCDNHFFQVIEGETAFLSNLYQELKKDERHYNIVKMLEQTVEEREFPNWSMGYAQATQEEINKIDGLNDFFTSKKCLENLDGILIKKLLRAFSSGRYRV